MKFIKDCTELGLHSENIFLRFDLVFIQADPYYLNSHEYNADIHSEQVSCGLI